MFLHEPQFGKLWCNIGLLHFMILTTMKWTFSFSLFSSIYLSIYLSILWVSYTILCYIYACVYQRKQICVLKFWCCHPNWNPYCFGATYTLLWSHLFSCIQFKDISPPNSFNVFNSVCSLSFKVASSILFISDNRTFWHTDTQKYMPSTLHLRHSLAAKPRLARSLILSF